MFLKEKKYKLRGVYVCFFSNAFPSSKVAQFMAVAAWVLNFTIVFLTDVYLCFEHCSVPSMLILLLAVHRSPDDKDLYPCCPRHPGTLTQPSPGGFLAVSLPAWL